MSTYSVINNYNYEGKNPLWNTLDTLSAPCRGVLGGSSVELIELRKNHTEKMATWKKVAIVIIAFVFPKVGLFFVGCFVLKVVCLPWFWEKKKVEAELTKYQSQINQYNENLRRQKQCTEEQKRQQEIQRAEEARRDEQLKIATLQQFDQLYLQILNQNAPLYPQIWTTIGQYPAIRFQKQQEIYNILAKLPPLENIDYIADASQKYLADKNITVMVKRVIDSIWKINPLLLTFATIQTLVSAISSEEETLACYEKILENLKLEENDPLLISGTKLANGIQVIEAASALAAKTSPWNQYLNLHNYIKILIGETPCFSGPGGVLTLYHAEKDDKIPYIICLMSFCNEQAAIKHNIIEETPKIEAGLYSLDRIQQKVNVILETLHNLKLENLQKVISSEDGKCSLNRYKKNLTTIFEQMKQNDALLGRILDEELSSISNQLNFDYPVLKQFPVAYDYEIGIEELEIEYESPLKDRDYIENLYFTCLSEAISTKQALVNLLDKLTIAQQHIEKPNLEVVSV